MDNPTYQLIQILRMRIDSDTRITRPMHDIDERRAREGEEVVCWVEDAEGLGVGAEEGVDVVELGGRVGEGMCMDIRLRVR